jgi:PII-like signaling protein
LRSTDQSGWRNAADALVERSRHCGLAGATQLHGIYGFGLDGVLLETSRWAVVERTPVIVEIVDSRDNVGRFLSEVVEIAPEAVVTLERAHVMLYRHNAAAAEAARTRLDVPGLIEPLSTLPTAEEFPMMQINEAGQLLRVFIGESDTWHGEPLYRAIVLKARELGLAGASVLRGTMGYGAHTRLHTNRLLELSTDLPIVVELVDVAEKLESLLPFLDETVTEGMITIEAVRVLKYRT